MELHTELKALGTGATKYLYDKPDKGLLESFPSPFSVSELNPCGCVGELNIVCPEMTSLCPLTLQPDFATIIIDYAPDQKCVESKSLKLYLGSFRNSGEFHEAVVNRICNDLVELLDPHWIKIKGEFTPRGGIPFWPTAYWEK